MQKKEKQVLRKNQFSTAKNNFDLEKIKEGVYWLSDSFQKNHKEIMRDDCHILDYYIMDPASYLAAEHFPISESDKVLDMCAAPGGKGLILAEKVFLHGELILNELSEARRDRLIKVVKNYIPREKRNSIWVKGWDAQFYGLKMPETFDKILLDAPCSGERHLIESEKDIFEWSLKKSERLAVRQYSLLASAYMALKPGGLMMYSTCSLNPIENDKIIFKLLKKKKKVKTKKIKWQIEHLIPEETEFGYIFLPDKFSFGPIYLSLCEKEVF